MTTISQPSVTSAILPASTVVPNEAQRVLFVGQMATGTATPGSLITNIQLNAEDGLFGANSMLAAMIRVAREINKVNTFDAIPLADAGGAVQASATIAFSGPATEAGEYEVMVGSEINHTYTITIADTDDATAIGDALVAVITADTEAPVTAANVTGTVTLTAVNGGTVANGFAISVSPNGTVAGVTSVLTAFTSGAGDPDTTDIFDVVGGLRYQGVAWPYWNDTQVLRDFLQGRWNVANNVLDGVGISASVEDHATALARLDALNAQTYVEFVDKPQDETYYKGSAQPELSYVKASVFAATRALRLSDGEPISEYVLTSNGPRDAFGGPALASKPYFNTATPDLPLVGTGRGWTELEITQLDDAGGSVLGNNIAGNAALVGEVHTTYKNDAAGNPDVSFKYLNYVDTISQIREYFFRNLKARFGQSRLSEGDVVPGRDVATPVVIASFCTKLYSDLQGEDFVLVEAGEDSLNFFKGNLTVTVDKSTGTATITSKVVIVTQLRRIEQTIQLAFTAEG